MPMSWRRWMHALWPFGRPGMSPESTAAVADAERSHQRAVQDRCAATAQRAEAEAWAAQVRDHNTANRYDIWLAEVMQGRKQQ